MIWAPPGWLSRYVGMHWQALPDNMRIKPKQGDQADWLEERGLIIITESPVQGNASAQAFTWVQPPVHPQVERALQTPRQMQRALQNQNRNRGRSRGSNLSWVAQRAHLPSVSQQASTPATCFGQSAPFYGYGQPAPPAGYQSQQTPVPAFPYLQHAHGQSSQLPLPQSQPDAARLRDYLASLGPQLASLQPYLASLQSLPASHPPQQAELRVAQPADDKEINHLDRLARNHRVPREKEQDNNEGSASRGSRSSIHPDTRSDYRAPARHEQENSENLTGLRLGGSTHTDTHGSHGGHSGRGG
jgi:hypothetical protein